MPKKRFVFSASVWIYPGAAAWHFLSVPKKESAEIKNAFHEKKRGWGSLPVTVTVGKTTWETSIFPDSKSGTYLLPLKAGVRKKEDIYAKDVVQCVLRVRV